MASAEVVHGSRLPARARSEGAVDDVVHVREVAHLVAVAVQRDGTAYYELSDEARERHVRALAGSEAREVAEAHDGDAVTAEVDARQLLDRHLGHPVGRQRRRGCVL